MAKYKIRNLKFLKQTFKVSIKTFCKKWEEETLPKWLWTWKMPKRISSWQSRFNVFQTFLARSNDPHFSFKKESVIMLKIRNF